MNEDKVPYLQLVTTIREKCRRCYTCVRECPAKAIQIEDGQASVIQTRCIGCGNCVTVCSQNAKQVLSGIEDTEELLAGDAPVAAIVAPSYPAEFTECSTAGLVGALRELGFAQVHEVSFGADLVAAEYARLLEQDDARHIATTCPAVVSYVRKYHPDILDSLAPIVSPMLATARVLHEKYGPELKIVFIGPCIAKKGEARYEQFEGEVHAALTYVELRALLASRGVQPHRDGRRGRRLRPAARQPRRPLPHHPRHAAGGATRRGPAERRHRERRRPPEPGGGHHRLRARRHRGAAARHPLLRGLHHGRRLQLRGAGVQAPLGRQPRDARAPEGLRPGGLGGRRRRVRRHRPLAHLRSRSTSASTTCPPGWRSRRSSRA